ncbi:AAA family ATPase [Paenibacillus sp. Soil750]|uniref:AAA family ATPase n=1 Tax=Paenibacillus sp. Soil750 TaxID=1736398 RepID=UPI0006F5D922|nr:AAA family ATPase [Paenibacillus sp. Soil750]KRE73917.1 hypothetical protein ASL11_06255 [Paenibacillus sp. Soil750]
MAGNFGFPEEILNSDKDKKITYFKKYTVSHYYLKHAYKKLCDTISKPVNTPVILVYGPCGVGKTTLFLGIAKHFIELAAKELTVDPGRIPIAGMEAIAPDTGNFDWKDHYIRSLKSLDEPLIEKKIDFESRNDKTNNHLAARAFRSSLENALKYRRPYAYMIDEAQHLAHITSGRKLRNQMDVIKSLASNSRVPHVLYGTYELLPFRNLSGQLSRRGIDIHLPRYRTEVKGDMDQFIFALGAFQKHLPLENEPKLVDNYEYFYQRSLGCVGILKDWLLKSYTFAIENKRKVLSMDICKEFSLSDDQCVKIIREAREGESLLEENQEKQNELLRLLGMDTKDDELIETTGRKRKNKVGEQNPTRHNVGEVRNAQ